MKTYKHTHTHEPSLLEIHANVTFSDDALALSGSCDAHSLDAWDTHRKKAGNAQQTSAAQVCRGGGGGGTAWHGPYMSHVRLKK